MSNRRRPRRPVPLDGQTTAAPPAPTVFGLDTFEWTDQPAAVFSTQVLEWIVENRREAMRLNAWTCEACGEPFIAYDRQSTCQGSCQSGFYTAAAVHQAAKWHGQQQVTPSHEWYRPSRHELAGYDAAMRSHVVQGGLALRALPGWQPLHLVATSASKGGGDRG